MGNLLDQPKTVKEDSELKICCSLEIGATGMQGWRLEMEDAHLVEEVPSKKDHIFLGVFDGHGGWGAARYVANHLMSILEATPEWKQYCTLDAAKDDVELVGESLRKAFLKCDELLKQFQGSGEYGADTSGCTAVTAMITPRYIICANAGDSRCVLSTNNHFKEMSFDHKPYNPEERERIEKAGGFVQWKRVDGDLAVSRALGDFQYKQRDDLPDVEQRVSPEPEIVVYERNPSLDEFLLLACDGLWDIMQSDEAMVIGRAIFTDGESDMKLFAEEMIDIALEKNSRDNISAVAVKLEGANIGDASKGGVMGRREIREREKEKRNMEQGEDNMRNK
jgi:serine/threonine protein phosphatase PrpC